MTAASTRTTDVCNAGDFWTIRGVWERQPDSGNCYMSAQSQDCAVSAFFHGISPQHAARLPGWCGNAVLASAEVRSALPEVEAAAGNGGRIVSTHVS